MILRPVLRSVLRPVLRSPFQRGSGGFSPAQVYSSGAAGLWLDPSDITTGFQDSAGTTAQTATGQPTGKRLDRSGRSNHFLQAGASARPEYTVAGAISSDWMDGSDDGYSTAAFAAGTLTANMDLFFALRRDSAANIVSMTEVPVSGTRYLFQMDAGAVVTCGGVGAAWTTYVDGVQVGGTANATSGQVKTAATQGAWHVLELRNLDLSLWTRFTVGLYTGLMLAGDVGGLIVCPAQASAVRTNIRRWLGRKVGLSL